MATNSSFSRVLSNRELNYSHASRERGDGHFFYAFARGVFLGDLLEKILAETWYNNITLLFIKIIIVHMVRI